MSSAPVSRSFRAPAKINLGLRLMGLREDGYHLLESVFAPIELWDELEIAVAPGPRKVQLEIEVAAELPSALANVSVGPDNLVVRAAEIFCKETGFDAAIRLRLHKQIPAGAGLGGGSSDAAAVLIGLTALSGIDPGHDALHRMALALGADVPFFLAPEASLVSGIGERITRVEGLPALDLVLANPGNSLSTAEVYRAADALGSALTEPRAGSTMRAISRLAGETGDLTPALGDLLINDLEAAARRLCPPVARVSERLFETGAIGVSMSGSGATVFGVFETANRANEAAVALKASGALRSVASESGRSSASAPSSRSARSATKDESRDGSWVRVTRIIPNG